MDGETKLVLCPYCGHTQPSGDRCAECGGLFEPLSRKATQISMGPWFIRDKRHPFRPGCSYEVLVRQIKAGRIKPTSILRGPSTRQFWSVARNVPGVAHLLGYCPRCGAHVSPDDAFCPSCTEPFTPVRERNELGLLYASEEIAGVAQRNLEKELAQRSGPGMSLEVGAGKGAAGGPAGDLEELEELDADPGPAAGPAGTPGASGTRSARGAARGGGRPGAGARGDLLSEVLGSDAAPPPASTPATTPAAARAGRAPAAEAPARGGTAPAGPSARPAAGAGDRAGRGAASGRAASLLNFDSADEKAGRAGGKAAAVAAATPRSAAQALDFTPSDDTEEDDAASPSGELAGKNRRLGLLIWVLAAVNGLGLIGVGAIVWYVMTQQQPTAPTPTTNPAPPAKSPATVPAPAMPGGAAPTSAAPTGTPPPAPAPTAVNASPVTTMVATSATPAGPLFDPGPTTPEAPAAAATVTPAAPPTPATGTAANAGAPATRVVAPASPAVVPTTAPAAAAAPSPATAPAAGSGDKSWAPLLAEYRQLEQDGQLVEALKRLRLLKIAVTDPEGLQKINAAIRRLEIRIQTQSGTSFFGLPSE